jgi:hypothetical protein
MIVKEKKVLEVYNLAKITDWRRISWSEIHSIFREQVGLSAERSGFVHLNFPRNDHWDVWMKNPSGAKNAIMVIDLEGPAGSYVQIKMAQNRFFREKKDTAIIFAHALNRWGHADEEESATQTKYGEIPRLVMPDIWDEAGVNNLLKVFASHRFSFSNGLFCRGDDLRRSSGALQDLCECHLSGFDKVSVFDIHSGFGRWGRITPLSYAATLSEPLARRTKEWFGGEVEFPCINTEVEAAYPKSDNISNTIIEFLPDVQVTPIALEFGMEILLEKLLDIARENRPYEREIEESFWDHLYPSGYRSHWLKSISTQTERLARKMILGMSRTV